MVKLDNKTIKKVLSELRVYGLVSEITIKDPGFNKRLHLSISMIDYELTVWSTKYRIYLALQSLKNLKKSDDDEYICSNEKENAAGEVICPNRQKPTAALQLFEDSRIDENMINEITGNFVCIYCGSDFEPYSEKQKSS
eukprot:UN34637